MFFILFKNSKSLLIDVINMVKTFLILRILGMIYYLVIVPQSLRTI